MTSFTKRRPVVLALVAMLIAGSAGLVFARSIVIRITVKTGFQPPLPQVVRGVKVRVTNLETGKTYEGTTDGTGEVVIDTGESEESASPVYRVSAEGEPQRFTAVGSGSETKVDLVQSGAGDDPSGIRSFKKALDDYARAHGLTGPPNWWMEQLKGRSDGQALEALKEYMKRLRLSATGQKPSGPAGELSPYWSPPMEGGDTGGVVGGPGGPIRGPRPRSELSERDEQVFKDQLDRINKRTDLTPTQKQDLVDKLHRDSGVEVPPRPPQSETQGPLPAPDPSTSRGSVGDPRAEERAARDRELEAIDKSDLSPEEKARLRDEAIRREQRGEPPLTPPDTPFPTQPYDEFGLPRARNQFGEPFNPPPPPPPPPVSLGPRPSGTSLASNDSRQQLEDVNAKLNLMFFESTSGSAVYTNGDRVRIRGGGLHAVSTASSVMDANGRLSVGFDAVVLDSAVTAGNAQVADQASTDQKSQNMGGTLLGYANTQTVISANLAPLQYLASTSPDAAFRALAGARADSQSAWWRTEAQSALRKQPVMFQVLFTSLGKSSGPAFTMTVVHDSVGPLQLLASGFVLQPLRNVTEAQAQRALAKVPGKRATVTISAYCLDQPKTAPTLAMLYRLAPTSVQERYPAFPRIMTASKQLQEDGRLHSDGNPENYFHAIRQWAVWTVEQGYKDEAAFSRAFLDHAKKNLATTGRRWTREIEDAVTELLPNRWRDIQQILGLAK